MVKYVIVKKEQINNVINSEREDLRACKLNLNCRKASDCNIRLMVDRRWVMPETALPPAFWKGMEYQHIKINLSFRIFMERVLLFDMQITM